MTKKLGNYGPGSADTTHNLIFALRRVAVLLSSVALMGVRRIDRKNGDTYFLGTALAVLAGAAALDFTGHGSVLVHAARAYGPPWLPETVESIHPAARFGILFSLAASAVLLLLGLKPFREKKGLQEAVDGLGLSSGTGRKPEVVSIADRGKMKKTALIKSFAVGPEKYRARLDDLQSATGWIIDGIRRSKDPTFVEIDLTEKALPKKIAYGELAHKVRKPYQFVVGESLSGTVLADLEGLPHLLVAGMTGSGKSTFLNAFLTALLTKPGRLRVYGIDLKIVELAPYKKFPRVHVDDSLQEALVTLRGIKRKMERRYRELGRTGHRKIDPERDKLDRIVVVVDECSDLYGKVDRRSGDYRAATECKEITDAIARKGRAAGIHLVLATQRASAQTLDSRILANVPSKICFKMASVANSVLVLNSKAAFDLEKIPGRAYWSNGTDLTEVQIPYITEEEVEREAQIANFEHRQSQKDDTETTGSSKQADGSEDADFTTT